MAVILILILTFGVLAYASFSPRSKALRRMKKLEKARRDSLNELNSQKVKEDSRKTGLNIPGYYEDIVNKDKLKQTYKWNLYDFI